MHSRSSTLAPPSTGNIGNSDQKQIKEMAQKVEAKGGNGGNKWDDGTFDGVRKIYIGKGQGCIAFIKFEYVNGSEVVVGDEHGNKTALGAEEFEVDPDDYIILVTGFRNKVDGQDTEVVTDLIFRTYKGKTSQPIERKPGTRFVLQGAKIVGFHGRSSNVLNSLGVYYTLPSTPNLLGKWIEVDS